MVAIRVINVVYQVRSFELTLLRALSHLRFDLDLSCEMGRGIRRG
jgi:hypothetical protein